MKTYQDLQAVGENIKDRMEFVQSVISEHKNSDDYKIGEIAYEYFCHRNITINNFRKMLYKKTGEAVEDIWGSNFKMGCRHFYRFLTYQVQFLLGNGVQWDNKAYRDVEYTDEDGEVKTKKEMYYPTAEKLGKKKQYSFDNQLQDLATKALWGGVSFGFLNKDHIDVFSILEFAPLYDEENGSIRSGVRFWQIDNSKPLRATLYEEKGYTDMMFYTPSDDFRPSKEWDIVDNNEGYAIKNKKPYITIKKGDAKDKADNTEIIDGANYPAFPIVPLYGNKEHQSEIVGLREQIDCYDLIKSGFANNIDQASFITWVVKGADGVNDIDLQKFIEQIKTVHATDLPEGAEATPTTLDAPFNGSETLLDRLDKDLYRDAMALDTHAIASGATTATQIRAAYEPLNSKTDSFEYCVLDFIYGILDLLGIEDEATFARSYIINTTEEIQATLQSAPYMAQDDVVERIYTLMGLGDKVETALTQMNADELERFSGETNGN